MTPVRPLDLSNSSGVTSAAGSTTYNFLTEKQAKQRFRLSSNQDQPETPATRMHQRDSATSIFDHPCNRSSEASQHGGLAVRVTCQNGRAPRTFQHVRRAGTKLRLLAPGRAGPEIQSGEGMEDIDICTDRYIMIAYTNHISIIHTIYTNVRSIYLQYYRISYNLIILSITIICNNLGNNLDPNMARLQHIFKDQAPQLLAGWTWIQKVSESRNFSIHASLQGSRTSIQCSMSQCSHCIASHCLIMSNAFRCHGLLLRPSVPQSH